MACREAAKHPEVTSLLSPLTPTYDNPDFPPGIKNNLLCHQTTNKPLLVGECFHKEKFKDYVAPEKDRDSLIYHYGRTSNCIAI